MSDSNSAIFLTIASQHLKDETERRLLEQFHKRVQFKFWAAKQFLSNLKRLERRHGALTYPKTINRAELNLDAFLYEVVGTLDPLLQEINIAFRCNLEMQDVNLERIIPKILGGSQLRKKLGKLNGDSSGWFWKLREYRNHSAHRSQIRFFSTGTSKLSQIQPTDSSVVHLECDKITAVYLIDNQRDFINGDRSKYEVIPYCTRSVINMKRLVGEVYQICTKELSKE
jgi:hypothetical protein